MRYLVLLSVQLFILVNLFSQTVIIDKEIQIGQSDSLTSGPGSIRYNNQDFEGFHNGKWNSFTETDSNIVSNGFSSSLWGRAILYFYEDQGVLAPDADDGDYFG